MLTTETFERTLNRAPEWLAALQTEAFEAFSQSEMPTEKVEAWKYVNLGFDLADYSLADPGADDLGDTSYLTSVTERTATVTILDGSVTGISDNLPHGLSILQMSAASEGRVSSSLAAVGDSDIFSSAHRSFVSDGVFISVARNTSLEHPIVIDVQSTQDKRISFPHISLQLDENSEARFLVVHRSASVEAVSVPQMAATVGAGARLAVTGVQAMANQAASIGFGRIALGKDASLKLGEVGLGGSIGRMDLVIDHDGDGSSSEMAGVYFGDGSQVMDYRIVVNHTGRNTSSNVYLKGAVEDEAQSVFTGLLKINVDATNTSAFETNRNLVLSEGAKAHSVPNLEILCDEVVCGHASTVGPLEEDHLYYLQSRGLPRDRAERVLLRGFFEEMIAKLPARQIAEPVRVAVNAKFIEAQAEGRI